MGISFLIFACFCVAYIYFWFKALEHYSKKRPGPMILFPEYFAPEGIKYHRILVVLTIFQFVFFLGLLAAKG